MRNLGNRWRCLREGLGSNENQRRRKRGTIVFVLVSFAGTARVSTSRYATKRDQLSRSSALLLNYQLAHVTVTVGERLGRGQTLEQILAEMDMVAEGVWTTKALFGPESALGSVPMPIAEQVHAVLFEGKDPRTVVTDLMTREPAAEMDGLAQTSG